MADNSVFLVNLLCVTASGDDDDDDDVGGFGGADDFARKKISADKSKPAKAAEVNTKIVF